MSRCLLLSCQVVLLLAAVLSSSIAGGPSPASAASVRADEEPELVGIKLSAWITKLREDKDPKQRQRAVTALDVIGATKSRKIIPALEKAVKEDKDDVVREKAVAALGRSVSKVLTQAREEKSELPKIDTAREALTTALRFDKIDRVREAAARALGEIGPDARGAVGSLGGALKDKHAGTVAAAATALRRMGPEARDAQTELTTLLGDKKAESAARIDAAGALGSLGSDARDALPTIKEVLIDPKAPAELRKAVIDCVGRLGKDAADLLPQLGDILISKNHKEPVELRLEAVTVLDGFGVDAKPVLPALVKAVKDEDKIVRCLALHSIGRMGKDFEPHRKETLKDVKACLEDAAVEVRLSAIEMLGALGVDGLGTDTTEMVKALRALAENDSRKSIREAAAAAAEKILPKK